MFSEQIGIDREDCGSVFSKMFAMKRGFLVKENTFNKVSGALYLPQNAL